MANYINTHFYMSKCHSFLLSLFFVCFLISCDNTNYKSVIPVDATFVASVNVESLVEKSEVSNSAFFVSLKNNLENMISAEAKEEVVSYVSSPEKIGLDFRHEVYVFTTPNKCMGITIKVDDKNAVTRFWDLLYGLGLAGNTVERDGLIWSSFMDDVDIVYNDDTFLMFFSLKEGGSAISKQTASILFTLDEEYMYVNSDEYKECVLNASEDIVMSSEVSLIPSLGAYADMLLCEKTDLKDLKLFSTLNFEEGKIVCDSRIQGKTEHINEVLDNVDEHYKNIVGHYIDSPVDSFLVWSCLGVDGEWLLKTLKKNDEIKQTLFLLGRAIDIDMMIKSFDGDCAFMIPHTTMTTDSDEFDYSIIASLSDKNFLSDVDYWNESMKEYGITMDNIGKDQYVLNADDYVINWGVDGNSIFFASKNGYQKFAFSKRSDLLERHRESILNSKMYTYVNLKVLPLAEISNVLGINVPNADKVLNTLEAMVFKSESIRDLRVELIWDNNDDNILKKILN